MKKTQKQKFRWGEKTSLIDTHAFNQFGVFFRQVGEIA